MVEAKEKYRKEYLGTVVDWPKWKGDISSCKEGHIPSIIKKKALLRINYFRTLSGLYPINLNEEYNHLAQEAAFLIKKNNRINHFPPKTWECYSNEAAKACQNSSLGLVHFGYNNPITFITGFIQDDGDNNIDVGHRRSILNSTSGDMGYGATSGSEVIYHSNIKSIQEKILPEFIAYPISGYNEIDLVFDRWSFGIPKHHTVDFSDVEVILNDDKGIKIDIKLLPYKPGNDPTIVWELKSMDKKKLLNSEITVRIKNVVIDGRIKNFNYKVDFFDF
ncbi:CAP domain-containing protein [Mangrovivirga sp. M17]|uniref:CAP domain-containing protein n=1 Tax=Mangrovivirga halotolerans TaxID=2993936 RepID=A0ABT3RWD0_9BACT|nr:CAP domain-containing protein [Mangrovivirga halotolerans]MCX2745966.1 CAP domain-containing protein [Mangrovivirga halotolerans]